MPGDKASETPEADPSPGPSSDVSAEQLRDLRRAAFAELQRQLRNVFAVMRSIARRTAETSGSLDEFVASYDGRLNAYARTLSLLSHDPDRGADLEFLLAEELLSVQAHEGEQVGFSGPSVQLQPRAAETIGLAIHELATNAIKHGALGQAGGKIDISWRFEPDGDGRVLVFDWNESSGRKLMMVPTRRGFGTAFLEQTLPYELNARSVLRFGGTGFRCRIRFPVNDQILVRGDYS